MFAMFSVNGIVLCVTFLDL